MKILIIIIILGVFLTSCYDNTLVDPGKGYSNLIVKVLNKEKLPAKNAEVVIKKFIGNSYEQNEALPFIKDSTNNDGELKTKLLEGEYLIEARIYKSLAYYSDVKALQMIGGLDRNFELSPYNNVGKLSFIIQNSKRKNISNINVSLISIVFEFPKKNLNDYLSYDFLTSTTDTSGQVTFNDIPDNYSFGLVVFYNDSLFYSPLKTFEAIPNYEDNSTVIICPF